MKPLSKRRTMAAGLILLLLFLFRPGVSRLKSRVIASISAGVGRPADIGSIHFRLLPRPGFDLENLVVYDDPAFGSEPMLRASEVTADLRLISLLRGRLEISELDLTEPSLNLVHGDNGRWNLEALLERSSHMPLAPTAKVKSERREEFPYIHANSARINFKSGFEKKPYALTNADFSLWQESEDTWGLRLKAQPVRTDLNLNDTGVLQVDGKWRRASAFRETPMDFRLEWSRGQLGQLTKFFSGNDKGWRGGVQVDANVKGTPAKLDIVTDASVDDFRRYDITTGDALKLAAHCESGYSAEDHKFHQVNCQAPVADGIVTLKGDAGLPGSHTFALTVSAERVPSNAAAALARRVKKNLPDDLTASGTIGGRLDMREDASEAKLRLAGKGELVELHLASATSAAEIGPETIPIVIAERPGIAKSNSRGENARVEGSDGAQLEIGPFALGTGHTAAPAVRAWLSRGGYDILVSGDADVAKVLKIAHMAGIPALEISAEGTAIVELQAAGSWANGPRAGFVGPQVTGEAKLRNLRVNLRGTAGPAEIVAADMKLLPAQVQVSKLNVLAGGTKWTGSLDLPRGCGNPEICRVNFEMNADRVGLGDLADWVHAKPKARPWYRVLETTAPGVPSLFSKLRGSGHMTADHLQVERLAATHVAADVEIDGGKWKIGNLSADLLGGKYRGKWTADFAENTSQCEASGALTGVSLAKLPVSAAWITGTASGNYQLKGPCWAEFWSQADGIMQFDVRDGSLPHLSLNEYEGSLKVSELRGQARIEKGNVEIKDTVLDSPNGKFQLAGTVGEGHGLDVKLTRRGIGGGYTISGTLNQPRVTSNGGAEQAKLKR